MKKVPPTCVILSFLYSLQGGKFNCQNIENCAPIPILESWVEPKEATTFDIGYKLELDYYYLMKQNLIMIQ